MKPPSSTPATRPVPRPRNLAPADPPGHAAASAALDAIRDDGWPGAVTWSTPDKLGSMGEILLEERGEGVVLATISNPPHGLMDDAIVDQLTRERRAYLRSFSGLDISIVEAL